MNKQWSGESCLHMFIVGYTAGWHTVAHQIVCWYSALLNSEGNKLFCVVVVYTSAYGLLWISVQHLHVLLANFEHIDKIHYTHSWDAQVRFLIWLLMLFEVTYLIRTELYKYLNHRSQYYKYSALFVSICHTSLKFWYKLNGNK